MIYDLIIVGAGPSGLTSFIYSKRSFINSIIFEKLLPGGKLNKTEIVDNYPGFSSIKGIKLAKNFFNHAKKYKNDFNYDEILELNKKKDIFFLKTNDKIYKSKTVIICSGSIEKKLNVNNEEKFYNSGIYYCYICDGFLFKDKTIMIVGGGYNALESALYMSKIANKIYLIHRKEKFLTEEKIIEKVIKDSKIEIIFNYEIKEIKGKEKIDSVILKSTINKEKKYINIDGIFPCIGLSPYSNLVHFFNICDKDNYISIKSDCSTSIPGLFAAGDVARIDKNKIRQIVTSVSEGAIAAQSAIKYLKNISN